jgi:ATP-dependent Lon protease
VATGLAWTPYGGEVLQVETTVMSGKGTLTLTGQLGEVMKESAQAALSIIRARAEEFGLKPDIFKESDIHIHVPAGAIPKDGPSAGVTMLVSLTSALAGIPVHHQVAMTGEITLTGRVMPIGGLKEKVLAAVRYGATTVLFPAENRKDLEDIPKNIRRKIELVPVANADEVLKQALEWEPRPRRRRVAAKKKAAAVAPPAS